MINWSAGFPLGRWAGAVCLAVWLVAAGRHSPQDLAAPPYLRLCRYLRVASVNRMATYVKSSRGHIQ